MDVIQARQAGFLNVVAQMGTAMTERQVQLIAPRLARRIVLALDADEAGQSAARRSLDVARRALARDFAGRMNVDMRVLRLPDGTDPDDFLRKSSGEWERLVADAPAIADFVIDMETSALSPEASVLERQAVAAEILPILLASENNLYRQENLQKLSRRLRIGERELLAWARQSLPVERPAKPPTTPETPPEFWLDESDVNPADAADWTDASDEVAPKTRPGERQSPALEPYCLSLLLKNPNLLYLANRKLRELAGDDDELLGGPLSELGVEDFTRSQYRALMARLLDSMAQDDQEPLDYLASVIDDELRAEFDALLLDAPEAVSRTMRRNFQVDLNDILRRRPMRAGSRSSEYEELISRALQLRLTRLENERIEMQYLQEEEQSGDDSDPRQRDRLKLRIMLSMRAKARLNLAVSRRSLALKQTSIS